MSAGTFEIDQDAEAVARGRAGVGRAGATLATGLRATQSGSSRAAGSWTGPRSAVFDEAARGTCSLLQRAEAGCAEVEAVLGGLGSAVRRAEHELVRLRARHEAITPAFDAPAAAILTGSTGVHQASAALRDEAEQVKRELTRTEHRAAAGIDAVTDRLVPHLDGLRADQVVRRVTDALGGCDPGRGVTGALAALTGALLVDDRGALHAAPGRSSPPTDVNHWWVALSSAQRGALLRSRPELFGNLDGVPALERDLANRLLLPRELAALRAELDERFPQGEPPRLHHTYTGYGAGPTTTVSEAWLAWDDLHQRVVGTAAILDRLAGDDGAAYLLIGFQPRVGRGRAVVSHGDPDAASSTSLLVPGTTARLGTVGGDLDRSDTVRTSALAASPGASVAAITWHGYDAPQTVLGDARRLGFADAAAPLLRRFATGLRATHRAGSTGRTTAVGHSYGTTLIGRAASHGHRLDVDDVVLVASPGTGVGNGWLRDDTSVDDLHLRGPSRGHVYAVRSRSDDIKWVVDTHLGVDPTRPSFGAMVFGADPWDEHGEYWDRPKGPAVTAMGQVVAGRGRDVVPPTQREAVHPPLDVSIAPGL